MSKEKIILEILQAVGVYQEVRRLVSSDEELSSMFDKDFDELIQLATK